MSLTVLFAFCLGVAAQAAPPPLKAPPQQEPPPPRPSQADDVTIRGTGGPEGSATVPPIQEAERRVHLTPGGVDVIDTEELRTGATLLPTDLFRFSAGVYMQSRFGSDESRMSIRGSGLQRTFHGRGIWVMQDGTPINLADGSFDMQAIEPLAARYVEVWRGGNALAHGASTLGGAINFVSPTGYDANVALGRFEGGSFGTMRGQVSSGHAVDGTDYYVSVTTFENDGYRDHADQSSQRLFSNLGYRIAPTIETRVYLTHARTDSELPGSLTKSQMRDDPAQAASASVTGDHKRDFWLTRVADKTTFSLGTEARFEATVAWSRKHLFHPIFQVIDQESDDFTGAFVYTSEARLFGSRNVFRMGFVPGYGLNTDERHANVGGHSGAQLAENDLAATSLILFLEEQHYVSERLAVVAGLQLARVELELDDEFPGVDNSDEEVFRAVNPKVGLRYELTDAAQLYGNVSRSFEPPSFGEIANSTAGGLDFPDAQTAWTFEIGARGRSGVVAWDLSLYWADVNDELLALVDALGNPLGTANADDTVHRGVELAVDLTLFEGTTPPEEAGTAPTRVLLRQSYMYNDFRFDDDPVYGNNALAGIPRHLYRLEIRLEHETGFYAAPNVEWASGWEVDHTNTYEAAGYATFGIQVGYRTRTFTLFVEGRNLADRVYSPTTGVVADAGGASPAVFNAADERSGYAGIEYRW